jgi:hypothetical protein
MCVAMLYIYFGSVIVILHSIPYYSITLCCVLCNLRWRIMTKSKPRLSMV